MQYDLKNITIAVLNGGIGPERLVSLQSGRCVYEALKQAGLNAILVDIAPDTLDILNEKSIDVFFPMLHGRFGEDGQLQRIMQDKGLCYTASGPKGCELAFDKHLSKQRFIENGIPTPDYIIYDETTRPAELREALDQIGPKRVIKPTRQGSSVGVSVTDDPNKAVEIAEATFKDFGPCLIEQFVRGREVTAGIVTDRVLPIVEIRPKNGLYDYHAKYVDDGTAYLFDTIDDAAVIEQINRMALHCFDVLEQRDLSRIDFILADDNRLWVLEANTIPGFTSHSLVPKAAYKAGMTVETLCIRIVEQALARKAGADRIPIQSIKPKPKPSHTTVRY